MLKVDTVRTSYKNTQIFRCVLCSGMFLNVLYFILNQGYFSYLKESMMFLTFWGHNFEIMFFMLLTRKTYELQNMKTEEFEKEMQKSFMAHLQSTVLGMQFLITFFYWIVIFNKNEERTPFQWYKDIYMHSVPLIIIFWEMLLNRMEIRMKHLKLTMIIIVFYGFVNLFFTLFNGEPVYNALDFQNMRSVLFLVGALITSVFGVVFFQSIQTAKLKFVNHRENKLRND